MRTAQQLHMERLTDEQARCFTIEWLAEIQREAFDAGATAMRDRIAAGLREWWTAAKSTAGRRWPGHPHAVVCKVEAIDVTTTKGRPGVRG